MVDSERVKQIVKEAAFLAEEERRAFLDSACGEDPELRKEVEALLEKEGSQDQPTLPVEKKAVKRKAQDFQGGHPPVPGEAPGEKIGPYELVEKIGEGGFGSVWMAQQREPIKRKVALKLIKLGMDTKEVIARFEAERQALALMDHPSIAKVIDAGSTRRGRPYFVMELVRGIRIDTYCDQNKLTMQERIALFIQVCNAIQHAHHKGIIHRDIKPSNVLVTLQDGRPLPKIIDFGIAKATHAELTQKTMHTRRGDMIGSPVYMSPEQAEMSGLDIDTRSDIYSLGVLLYELLTGTTPFDIKELKQKSLIEMLRVLREAEPETPSKRVLQLEEKATETAARRQTRVKHLVLTLKGDLDWIILKCLEKDRTRRYETANGLAEDLERYLKHEPVIARPPSAVYKMRKFVRRNRAWVFAGTAIITVLILGIIGTTLGMIRATKALGELEEVTAFQENQLSKIDAAVMGERLRKDMLEKRKTTLEKRGIPREEITRELEGVEASLEGVNFTDVALKTLDENIFEEALRTIEKDFANRPKIQARLYQTVATTLRKLGLLERATSPQEKALEIRRRVLGNDHPDTLQSINNMGVLLDDQGKYKEAETYLRKALEGRRRVLGNDHPDTLESINNMGLLLYNQGKYKEAETYWREALEGRRRVLGNDNPDTLMSSDNMGLLLKAQGKYKEAEPYYREALEGKRRVLGNDHPRTLGSIANMGLLLKAQGKYKEAETYYREALEGQRRVLGNDHPDTLESINNMGVLLWKQGKYKEAETYWREALEGKRRVLGNDHPNTLTSINNMGVLLWKQGKYKEAEVYYREALEGYRRVLGNAHPDMLNSINNMGVVLKVQGKYKEAGVYYREALKGYRRVLGNDHPDTLQSINSMGVLLADQGKYKEAEPYFREALEGRRRVLGNDHPDTLVSIQNMGALLRDEGKYEEAEALLKEARTGMEKALGPDHPNVAGIFEDLAELYKKMGKKDEAKRLEERAKEIRLKNQ